MAYTAGEWTASALSVELGIDRRTLGKALEGITPVREDRKSKFYRMRDVYRALLNRGEDTGTPQLEKARLDKLRADQVELTLEKERCELAPLDAVATVWSKIIMDTRTRMLAIPSKAAPELVGLTRKTEIQAVLETEIHNALHDVSEIDTAAYLGRRRAGTVKAAAKTNGKRVGRQGKKAKSRGKRGARTVAH